MTQAFAIDLATLLLLLAALAVVVGVADRGLRSGLGHVMRLPGMQDEANALDGLRATVRLVLLTGGLAIIGGGAWRMAQDVPVAVWLLSQLAGVGLEAWRTLGMKLLQVGVLAVVFA